MKIQELPYWGQLLIVVALCAGMGFVFYQFFYTNEVQLVTDLENRLDSINREIRKYEPDEHRKDELEAEIEQIKSDLTQLERVFPSVKSDVRVKRFIETVAREFDISIDSYRSGDRNEAEQYFEHVVNIVSKGRTIDFLRFFDALVRKDLVIHIYDLDMQRTRAERMEGDRYPVTASFRISSYVYKPYQETGSEE